MNIGSAPTICGSSIKGPSVVGVSATGFGLRPPPFTDTPTTDSHLDCRYARILSVAAHPFLRLLALLCLLTRALCGKLLLTLRLGGIAPIAIDRAAQGRRERMESARYALPRIA